MIQFLLHTPKPEEFDVSSMSTLPPILSIGDIKFSEKALDAGETATLSIWIKNVGSSDTRNLTIQLSDDLQGLLFPRTTNVPLIPKKIGVQTVDIPVEGQLTFLLAKPRLKST